MMEPRVQPHTPAFDPNQLFDSLLKRMQLKNDAALSRKLHVAPPVISKIRSRKLPLGASLLIRIHEETSLSIEELRSMMGDRRSKFRFSAISFKPRQQETQAA